MSKTDTIRTTRLNDAEAAKDYLDAAGTPGPSLHPFIRSRDHWRTWSGWNDTVAMGFDANGLPVIIEAHIGTAGHHSYASGQPGYALNGSSLAFTNVAFPIEVLPATTVIRHPQYTPGQPEVEPIWEWLAKQRQAREAATAMENVPDDEKVAWAQAHDLYDLVAKLLAEPSGMGSIAAGERPTWERNVRLANGFVR